MTLTPDREMEESPSVLPYDTHVATSAPSGSPHNSDPRKQPMEETKSLKSTKSAYTTRASTSGTLETTLVSKDDHDHSSISADKTATGEDKTGLVGWWSPESPWNPASILDAVVHWVEGPPSPTRSVMMAGDTTASITTTSITTTSTAAKDPGAGRAKNEKPNPIFEIPFQFIALLTYPEPDPRMGNKMSLAMVRETAFVRQRRKTLLMLTAYTFLIRYCSFDFFLVLVFSSNCGMLFLMKNSGRMNVTMAKRAVHQRVGWAKQWAGGIFRRGNSTSNNSNSGYINSGNANEAGLQQQQQHQGVAYSNVTSSKSISALSSTLAAGMGEKTESAQEESPQIKRRGLFGKRKITPAATNASSGASVMVSSILHDGSGSGAGTVAGDEVSVMTGRTQRRGFFKRNTNPFTVIGTNRSATAPPATILSNSAGPTKSLFSIGVPALLSPPLTGASSISSSSSGSGNGRNIHHPNTSTTRPSGVNLPASLLPQTQSLPQVQLPLRSPSPSTPRRDYFWPRTSWTSTPPPPSPLATAAVVHTETLPSSISSHQQQPCPDSTPSSEATSMSSSPKTQPSNTTPMTDSSSTAITALQTSMATTAVGSTGTGRASLASMNPRLLLSGLTQHIPLISNNSNNNDNNSNNNNRPSSSTSPPDAVPISPRPHNAASLSTTASSILLAGQSHILDKLEDAIDFLEVEVEVKDEDEDDDDDLDDDLPPFQRQHQQYQEDSPHRLSPRLSSSTKYPVASESFLEKTPALKLDQDDD
ncbi:hypothetical protein EDD11_009136 [Mortierella claussenii]|nr:hypothetical protein EDD11_009136 [Mortierella claussenii]